MSDGNLYGWGSNESGQMGIKTEIGIIKISINKILIKISINKNIYK